MVTFICELKPDAKDVYLTGDFNLWNPTSIKMLLAKDGSFRISRILPPGHYLYKFIIDGLWHNDPDAPCEGADQNGCLTSAFTIKNNHWLMDGLSAHVQQ